MELGWIKIHRKLQEKGYYKKSAYVHLWIHLLLSANRKPKEFMWNNSIVIVNEGQFITGRKTLSEETGIPEGTIENILKFLESQHQIEQQKSTKYRLITILNWKTYQAFNNESNNKPTTDEQQADTNKNTKNIKKEEKRESLHQKISYLKEIPESDIATLVARFDATAKQIKSKGEDLFLYCKSRGRIYKDYRAFLLNALKKDYKEKSSDGKEFIPGVGWVKK